MQKLDSFSWMIGGAQGSGVDSSATTFARACAAAGLHIYGKREYHSNIKGDHSYFQMRVSERPVQSHIDEVHLLATFDKETVEVHKGSVVPGGAILYDPVLYKTPGELGRDDCLLIPVPYSEIIQATAREFKREKDLMKLQIMKNVVSVAASLGLLGLEFKWLKETIEGYFTGRRAALAPMNVWAAEQSYKLTQKPDWQSKYPYRLKPVPVPSGERRLMINGTTAAALGKIVGGCRFQTYYPITPASDESEYLESHPEFGVTVVQSEDEIAAITMAIGAAVTGVRSSTSTSGPGFSLMAEGMGWAGMNEVPIVIFNYQRAGPATGLPTRHEQGDLRFVLTASHGEFPRLVLCPADLEEYFYDAIDAFNYAERYQTPVIVLCDKALANATQTIPWYDVKSTHIDRGLLLTDPELAVQIASEGEYKRFKLTESGISPRSVPGQKNGIFWLTGDEHDEAGHICEDPDNRNRMMIKRMHKLEVAAREIPIEKRVSFFGDRDADVTLVSWGSCKGAILDGVRILKQQGISANFLQIHMVLPFPTEYVAQILTKARRRINIEMNYSGQMAQVIREHTGITMDASILKWNGRAISENEVVEGVQRVLKSQESKVMLSHGA
ncbi:MAG: 2-oxoglutarate ferredoxin oxidoreductase subunit alpha [Candidatus Omnitrophica bacterium CG11_big_fil_rev_8_21_14_0_20_64_10]|nr:MAG: 2-oxoglutarate ferredoxin oxidoreductase subunit alpha [Candidatus Omnitrophica bacterium CG11_big_fil_rev_8_21_14_0_20_64_10]